MCVCTCVSLRFEHAAITCSPPDAWLSVRIRFWPFCLSLPAAMCSFSLFLYMGPSSSARSPPPATIILILNWVGKTGELSVSCRVSRLVGEQ